MSVAKAISHISEREPASLGSVNSKLRGDIEVVVGKAMSKEASRRYETVSEFAADLRRILRNEPVLARPPSVVYHTRKFVARNKVLRTSIVVVLGLLITSVILIGAQQRRAATEATTAKAVTDFLIEMLRSIDPDLAQGQDVTVARVLDDATRRLERGELSGQPQVLARLHMLIGEIYAALGQYEEARVQIASGLEIIERLYGARSLDAARAIDQLANVDTLAGDFDAAEREFLLAIQTRESLSRAALIASPDASMGAVYFWTSRFDEAEEFFRAALLELEGVDPATDARVGHTLAWLGAVLERQGKNVESLAMHRRAIDAMRACYGERHTEVAGALNMLANALEAAGRYEDALEAHRESLRIKRALLREDHPDIATSLNNLGLVYIRLGDLESAEAMLQEAIGIRLAALGRMHPSTASSYGNLGAALMFEGRLDEALSAFDEATAIAANPDVGEWMMAAVFGAHRGHVLAELGRYEEAERELLRRHDALVALIGADHRRVETVREYLAELYEDWGKPEEARKWQTNETGDGH